MLKLILFATLTHSCGGTGSNKKTPSLPSNLTGTIRSLSGSQSQMAGWNLVLVEKQSGICRVSKIGNVGNYNFSGVFSDRSYSLVLLDPSYRISSVIARSIRGQDKLQQFFKVTGPSLPALVQSGPIVLFSDLAKVTWDNDLASDSDQDGIPDGIDLSLTDTDNDGLSNSDDADLDGDGLVNWFDKDDDGDGIVDTFDADADGDGVTDSAQSLGQTFFNQGLDYVAVQVVQDVNDEGGLDTAMLLTAQATSAANPASVTIKGADDLLNNSNAVLTNAANGNTSTAPWDKSLADDGLNNDGAASDLLFARYVSLASGVVPKGDQVIFFQIPSSSASDAYKLEYPFTFPLITSGVISGTYDADSRTFTKSGTPFESESYYSWSVDIFGPSGNKIYSSPSIEGNESSFVMPSGILDDSVSYTAKFLAASKGGVLSYPYWLVRSLAIDL